MDQLAGYVRSVIALSAIGPMLKGLFTVDFVLKKSSQVKFLMILFSILKPLDLSNIARS